MKPHKLTERKRQLLDERGIGEVFHLEIPDWFMEEWISSDEASYNEAIAKQNPFYGLMDKDNLMNVIGDYQVEDQAEERKISDWLKEISQMPDDCLFHIKQIRKW